MQTPSDAGACGAELAISASGNSVSQGTVIFSNANNVSFGMAGSTVTASAGAGGGVGISAGTQSVSTGTVKFADSNGVAFGMAGSSQVTASFTTLNYSNSNNVSFGIAGSTLTASATMSQSTNLAAVAAVGGTITTGTASFANSNGVSFGIAGQTVTAAYSQSTNLAAAAAGSQTQTSGTLVFANSNGVTFGMSGSATVTASYSQQSYSISSVAVGPSMSNEFAAGASISFAHWTVPAYLSATQAVMRLDISANSTDATATAISLAIAIYTLSRSTASMASSGARTLTWASGNTTADTANYGGASGLKYRTIAFNASITPGDYMVAVSMSAASNITFSAVGCSGLAGLGSYDGIETSQWMDGFSNASTAAFPASFQVGDTGYVRTGAGAFRRPLVTLFGTF